MYCKSRMSIRCEASHCAPHTPAKLFFTKVSSTTKSEPTETAGPHDLVVDDFGYRELFKETDPLRKIGLREPQSGDSVRSRKRNITCIYLWHVTQLSMSHCLSIGSDKERGVYNTLKLMGKIFPQSH